MTTTKPPGRNPSSSSEERGGGWEAGRFPWRGRGIPPWRSRSRRPQRNESIRHEEIYRRGYHYPAPGPMDQVDAIVCLAEPLLPTYSDPARTLYDRTVPCVWSSPGRVIQSLDASFFFFKCATVTTPNCFFVDPDQVPTHRRLRRITGHFGTRPFCQTWYRGECGKTPKRICRRRGCYMALARTCGQRGKFVMKIAAGVSLGP